MDRLLSNTKIFDILFGILLPLVCLYLDPCVFDSPVLQPLIGHFQVFIHLTIFYEMILLSIWMAYPKHPLFFSIQFAFGTLLALGIGLRIFPYAVSGILIYGLGLLGFVPWTAAIVFQRRVLESWDAIPAAEKSGSQLFFRIPLAFIPFTLFFAADCFVQKQMDNVTHGTPDSIAILKAVHPMANFDPIVHQWRHEEDPMRKQQIADIYYGITGRDIAIRVLDDKESVFF